jgi:primosomal protein N' (replication factor Y) (superfamily II helicase)
MTTTDAFDPHAHGRDNSAGKSAVMTADVVIPVALDGPFSYRVPDGLDLAEGEVVRVPFGPRESVGVVWGLREGGAGNLKSIAGRADAPPLTKAMRDLIDWLAWYTLTPKGLALSLALRVPDPDSAQERPKFGLRIAGNASLRQGLRATPARARVLSLMDEGHVLAKAELARAASVSTGVIDGLVDEGVLEAVALAPEASPQPEPDHAAPALSPDQAAAAAALRGEIGAGFSVTLLEGVTGSGKTEVYFEAVAEALRQGKQALILMPEIALTAEFTARFEARFGVAPALWHSGVSGRRRERLQRAVASGEARVVAGARSALFLCFRELGLLVVDEEHEAAYKQNEGVSYHARDMGVVRARIEGFPVVLASATPSVESRVNAAKGRYRHLSLPLRHGGREMPVLAAIDLRKAGPPRGRWIAPALEQAVRDNLAAGEQSLLFLNRRGYAPLTLCNACGHRFQCPNCTAWLVDHRFRRALVCHHCGHIERRPPVCPACGAEDSLVACGPGVERLAEEAATLFPDARMIVLSSDFPGGTDRLRRELAEIAAGTFDIVIGTQLVAKGHNFPGMTLVGVIDADVGLTSGDPRAGERTFQILQQVTGRAGRGEKPGRALIQSHDPGHPVLQAILSGDTEAFYATEAAMREAAGLPPFGRLASLVISGTDKQAVNAHARALARLADAPAGAVVLGPAEPPLALVRGRHRVRLIVKAPRATDLQGWLRSWIGAAPKPKGNVRLHIDVDPQSFW